MHIFFQRVRHFANESEQLIDGKLTICLASRTKRGFKDRLFPQPSQLLLPAILEARFLRLPTNIHASEDEVSRRKQLDN